MSGGRYSGRPRSWKKGVRAARAVPADSREAQMVAEDEERKFREMAPRFGWCSACGVVVDEDHADPEKRKLHAVDCPYLPAERRRTA